MKTIKGPGIFLAQFMGDEAPFNDIEKVCKWASNLNYKGVQIWHNNPARSYSAYFLSEDERFVRYIIQVRISIFVICMLSLLDNYYNVKLLS